MQKLNSPGFAAAETPGTNNQRLLVCDLDGTLIDRTQKINAGDLLAVKKAVAAGLQVTICTGRSIQESIEIIRPLQLTGTGIFVNGATLNDMTSGKTLVRRVLEPAMVNSLIDFFGSLGHAVLLLVDRDDVPQPYYLITSHGPMHAATEEWFVRNRIKARETDTLDQIVLSHVVRLGIVVDVEHTPKIEKELAKVFDGRMYFHSLKAPVFDCHVIEVFPPHIDKWTGIVEFCRLENIDLRNVITVGDDLNDLPMLRQATLSYAMGNALDEVKKAAKKITRTQADGGVAAVIEEILHNIHAPEFFETDSNGVQR
jgi:Cof subfamily protein (haloacid dehalogenase superfamily)